MVTKNKLLKIKHTLENQEKDRNTHEASKMSSSGTAPVLNDEG